MKVLPILSLLLFSSALYSQSEPEKWIHAYLDFGYEERHLPPYTNGGSTYTNEHFELGFRNISPGYFKLEEKGIYREFSLTRLQFEEVDDVNYVTMPPFIVNSPRDGERTYTSGIGFQIESGLMPKKWFGGFFRPGIGLGAVPEVAYFRNIPEGIQPISLPRIFDWVGGEYRAAFAFPHYRTRGCGIGRPYLYRRRRVELD
ncbi:MAG: hypothetical protein IPG32_12800 [Saprospirales bacterium]|nr:hypothetical protein [Saprospirales bacterium]